MLISIGIFFTIGIYYIKYQHNNDIFYLKIVKQPVIFSFIFFDSVLE